MQHHSRVCGITLVLALVGWSCTQRLDPPASKTIDCVVRLESYDAKGAHRGSAGGIVLSHDDVYSYILTARHNLYAHEPFEPEDWGLLPMILPGATREVLLEPRIVSGSGHTKGEVVWEDAKWDALVFRVTKINRPAVEYWDEAPLWGAPSLTVGVYVYENMVMHFHGRYQGKADEHLIFSSHAHGGCSGGGVFVYTDGEWALSGLIVAIARNGLGIILHHITYAVPIYEIIEAIEGMLPSPSEEPPPDPLPLNILSEF